MFDLNPEILEEFLQLKNQGCGYSQIVRNIFSRHGEMSPPVMAHYFKKIYGLQALDFVPVLASWWPEGSSDISDQEFDRRISVILSSKK